MEHLATAFHGGARYRAAGRATTARALSTLVLFAAVTLLFACARRDPIAQLVEDVRRSVAARDADDFAKLLAPGYHDQEHPDAAAAASSVRRYFAAYDRLDLVVTRMKIEPGGETARARFRADLSGTPRNVAGLEGWLPRTASYDFELVLTRASGRWLIASAGWSPAG